MSNIIRRYIDHIKFAAFTAFLFITFLHVPLVLFFYHCVYGCTFYIPSFNSVSYSFFFVMFMYFYCYVCSVLYILFSSCQLALFIYPD